MPTITCPSCRHKVTINRNDCPHCNRIFENVNCYCSACGKYVIPNQKHECSVCGEKLDGVITDEIIYKIKNVKTIYDDGEENLRKNADNIIAIDGIFYYVLQKNEKNNTAQLITVNIYNERYDDGGHTRGEAINYVGKKIENSNIKGDWSTCTYNYKYSTLLKWMKEFYEDYLKNSPISRKIIPTDLKIYVNQTDAPYSYERNLKKYSEITLPKQYVSLPDAKKAMRNVKKFSYNRYSSSYDSRLKNSLDGFYIPAGRNLEGESTAYHITDNGFCYLTDVKNKETGVRPCFWVKLD